MVVPRTCLNPLRSLQQLLGLPARFWGPVAGRDGPKTVVVLSKPFPGLVTRCVLSPCGVERQKGEAETPHLVSSRSLGGFAGGSDGVPRRQSSCGRLGWLEGAGARLCGLLALRKQPVDPGARIMAAPRGVSLSGLVRGPKKGG